MSHKSMILDDRNQAQKCTYCIIPFTWHSHLHKDLFINLCIEEPSQHIRKCSVNAGRMDRGRMTAGRVEAR